MKKYLFLALIVPVLILSSCAGSSEDKVNTDEEISLAIGQSIEIAGEDLTIKFIDVVVDSRCPRGVDVSCAWEGWVSAIVEIWADGSSQQLKLEQPGFTEEPAKEIYKEYLLTFNIEPYPELDKQISIDEYRLLLTVSK